MKSLSPFVRYSFMIALVATLSGIGCSKKSKDDEGSTPNSGINTVAADENAMGDSDSGKAMGLKTVNFPYDSFALNAEGKAAVQANAQILKDKATAKVQIEGHCDIRGGIQYNLALGEKRANAVKNLLVEMGISADRITTISYGKERLLDQGTSDEAHAKNRRANFAVTSK